MSFDVNKVQFNAEEINAAGSADALYEMFYEAIADGFDMADLAVIPAAVPHIMALYAYLAEGSKAEYAKKLIALGVILERDNEWLNALDGPPVA